MERLQKYMSECGIASRRKSEELIASGKVKVNGVVIDSLGYKITEKDIVEVENKILKREEKEYYILYKPYGVISSVKDEKNRKTVISLIKSNKKLFPVGRLDYDTTGVLLITNDGLLSNSLIHPSMDIEKVYEVKIDGIIKIDEIKKIESGLIIDNEKLKKCKVKLKKVDKKNNKSYLKVVLSEGKNHEVKKLFSYFNYKVVKLKRIAFAFLTLDNLKEGEYRRLTPKEVKKLYSLIKN